MAEEIKKNDGEGPAYIELEHEFFDRFKDKDVSFKFRFKRPNTAQSNRFAKTSSKNTSSAFKNLLNDVIHPEDKAAFKKAGEEYSGLCMPFGNALMTSCGFGELGN